MKYKINSTGAVIVADLAFVEAHYPGDFTEVIEVDAMPPPPQRHISVGAFFDRFGAAKWAILADPNVQALVKDCCARKYINLDNPELPSGLDLLISAGHAIDGVVILNAAIADDERP